MSKIGWNTACTALQMAIAQRQPPAGLVAHTDRGSQYATAEHQQVLARHGLLSNVRNRDVKLLLPNEFKVNNITQIGCSALFNKAM